MLLTAVLSIEGPSWDLWQKARSTCLASWRCWVCGSSTNSRSGQDAFKPSICLIVRLCGCISTSCRMIGRLALSASEAHGRVFLPTVVAKVEFSPLDGSCSGAVPCEGLLVGLYGGWAEARQLVSRVQQSSKKHPVRLSTEELHALVKGAWRQEHQCRYRPHQHASARRMVPLGTLIGPRRWKDCGMLWSVRRRRGMFPTLFRPPSG